MFLKKTSVIVLAGLLTACGSNPPKPTTKPSDPPTSRQGTLVESYSANEVMIRAVGMGVNVEEARMDARKAAIWYALFGGTTGLLSTAEQKQAFLAHEAETYQNAMKYIALEGKVVSSQMEEKTQRIERLFRVNLEQLRADLTAKGVLTSTAELANNLANPTISVIAKNPQGQGRHAIGVFSEYLQDQGFNVVVMDATQKINDIVKQAATLSGQLDPTYLLALQTGSDIYITLDTDLTSQKIANNTVSQATVTATAYYTSTGQQIGASTGYSPERANVSPAGATAEAANDTANKVLEQIRRSWQKETTKGRAFKVVITSAPELGDQSRSIHQLVNQACPNPRRNAAGTHSFDYTLTCKDMDTMGLLFALQDQYTGAGKLFRVMDSGTFLVLKIAHSETDDIVIE
jgi:hypothetical protein